MALFDLDKAVAAWRQNLERSGSFLDEDIDELEAHLRDHVDALTQEGRSQKDAFETALQRLGPRAGIESEYRKVRFDRSKRKRSVIGALIREWELGKNYLVTALRNVKRNKSYALINVCGLAVGMAACLLIGLYVSDELSYDRFHENANRIAVVGKQNLRGQTFMSTPYPVAPTLEATMPEVERGVHILSRDVKLIDDAGESAELRAVFTNPAFLEVFTYPLIAGAPERALDDPNSLVMTRDAAERIFGSVDVVGQSVMLNYWGQERLLTVTGITEKPPEQSTLDFDLVTPMSGLPEDLPREGSWGASMFFSYVLLDSPEALEGLDERINQIIDRHDERDEAPNYTSVPLTGLYLSDMYPTSGFRGSQRYVYIFTTVALLVLLIAGINYINLSTALATRRTQEVGVRKTLGAGRFQLLRQFTVESILLCVIALVLAVGLSRIFLSGFNHLFGKDLNLTPNVLFLGLCVGSVAVGIIAGSYPAFHLSRLRPTSVLSGNSPRRISGRGRMRQALVVFQFAISVALIVGTLVIHRQLDYAQTKNLGFDGEQVVLVKLPMVPFWQMRDDVQRRTANHPSVVNASVANAAPASAGVRLGFQGEEVSPDARVEEEMIVFVPAVVDYDFVETLGLKLLAGRHFSRERGSDRTQAYILNETAVEQLGWTVEEAVGKPFALEQTESEEGVFGTVIGVVEDFHIRSLRDKIEPVALQIGEAESWQSSPILLAKLSPNGIRDGLDHVKREFERMAPDQPFSYEFLDDRFDAMYREEARLGSIFTNFAALAVFLACLGLFGLSAYAAESRTKEIGIRKVLGASVRDVISLLSRSFLLLVAVGFVIAAPASYLLMNRWLEDFAYRIQISPMLILAVGLLTLALALATVIYQAMKAALRNPTESLRYE